jgi:hypothetical protein
MTWNSTVDGVSRSMIANGNVGNVIVVIRFFAQRTSLSCSATVVLNASCCVTALDRAQRWRCLRGNYLRYIEHSSHRHVPPQITITTATTTIACPTHTHTRCVSICLPIHLVPMRHPTDRCAVVCNRNSTMLLRQTTVARCNNC